MTKSKQLKPPLTGANRYDELNKTKPITLRVKQIDLHQTVLSALFHDFAEGDKDFMIHSEKVRAAYISRVCMLMSAGVMSWWRRYAFITPFAPARAASRSI